MDMYLLARQRLQAVGVTAIFGVNIALIMRWINSILIVEIISLDDGRLIWLD